MRVGIDIRPLIFTRAGINTYLYNLIRNLKQMPGNEYFLFTPAASRIRWDGGGCLLHENVVRLPIVNEYFDLFWENMLLPGAVKRKNLDIFHGPRFFLPPGLNCRGVVSVYDLAFKKFPGFVAAKTRAYFDGLVRSAVKRAAKIIVCSAATKRDLLELYDVKEKDVAVIYGAADQVFSPAREKEKISAVKNRFHLREYILFTGTIEPRKNIDNLLEAYRLIKDKFPVDLVIAGGLGWLYKDIVRKAAAADFSDRVIFTGFVDIDELVSLYSGCEAFVFPSLYEGFGLPVLEAMSCGAPVVTSNTSSLVEIFGDSALLVDPRSPQSIAAGIADILSQPVLRDALRVKGLKRAQEFSWSRAAQETSAVYKEATA